MSERSAGACFSDELEDWLRSDRPKTLGALGEVFEERSFAVTILLLMFVPAIPAPTGGITHVFEAITVVLAVEMVLGRRTIWLPERWKQKELGSLATDKAVPFVVRRVRWFERFSRPRFAGVLESGFTVRVLGLVFIAFAVAAALAPPFSGLDTFPALGAVVLALGIILGDIVIVAIGMAIGAGGIVLIITLGSAAVRLVKSIF
jgi:hypothetical protein